MKVVALVSGGKDSCYAMMKCIQYDHQIVALANLMPMDDAVDELDSYMYQTVGHQIIGSYAECMGVPLFRRRIKGSTRHQNLSYRFTPGDEVEDMFILLHSVKKRIPSVSAVCSGAIASDYQRLRVESVCSRLGLVSLAYLWKQDQALLIQEMITNGITAITVKVAAMGFVPSKHLGKEMAYLQPYLQKLKELYGINICGEGGEYETLTLDCPLFTNARIVLDDFEVVLHSSDSIAPVGVLHPLAFHLENKGVIMPNGDDRINDASVWEVEDGDLDGPEGALCATCVTDSIKMTEHKYKLSRTKNTGAFSLCCWGQAPGERPTVESVQEDLEAVLRRIESQLAKYGFGWQNVLYIHLYIADMNDFTTANETYIKFITHERCEYGVPSRSTIELPLVQANLGRAYVEVLVANDNSKRVLHVQSISCWAPSCIGPYSQATLHKGVLYMAGQLGLDPPTMNLCKGGPAAELEQALKNSEAVAKCFNCSLAASAILFVIYCSKNIPPLEKIKIPEKLDAFLKELRSHESDNDGVLERLNPICLYVLVPNLPKGALVEVKPFLYVGEDVEITSRTVNNNCKILASDWGFQHADWHDSCIQRCVIHGKICAVFLSVTKEISAKMSSECLVDNQADRNGQISLERGEEMGNVARFTLYLLDKILMENDFSWADIMTLRFYFPTSLAIPLETLSHKFHIAFSQLAGTGRRIDLGAEPIFNLVPVLGAGSSSALMDDIISCELFAQKT